MIAAGGFAVFWVFVFECVFVVKQLGPVGENGSVLLLRLTHAGMFRMSAFLLCWPKLVLLHDSTDMIRMRAGRQRRVRKGSRKDAAHRLAHSSIALRTWIGGSMGASERSGDRILALPPAPNEFVP